MHPFRRALMMQRRRRAELMDQPGLEFEEHRRALLGLRRINLLSRTASILWPHIARLARRPEETETPIRVLDVATGGGDTPIALALRSARAGIKLEIDGLDVSSQAVAHARSQAQAAGASVRFECHDALSEPLPPGYDVVSCSLFLHHLAETEAVALLGRMAAAARCLVLVDDLIRSRRGYAIALIGCHLLSRSRVVHADGPVSVASAFTTDEALSLAERAGMSGALLTRHWPQRFLMTWSPR